jgi:hypothetical protein
MSLYIVYYDIKADKFMMELLFRFAVTFKIILQGINVWKYEYAISGHTW